ncbi:diacylglycerol kinase family protein [Asticcacaulis sp. AND118]|uniref:diacylglycerol/lipid kinase family protein n=1 Tax=Asticcacaulis sp. AND118 TaxID=2840468 RepID=UPI001CFFF7FC|nr:diacylglycerol kinase family protein [Asticcacaulis sp. AND118]UDF03535.1 diacylglycerol kinase [Asticcacaulis sp. AND118]
MAAKAYNILINGKAGTVLNLGRDAITAAIESSGMGVAELNFAEPEDIEATLDRFAKSPHPLLVGGGDGTLRSCAEYLSKKNKAFGILPFGTMNLLARDLGMDTLDAALKAYANGADETRIDAGEVNGELFLCCASIGVMPEASVFREQHRTHNFLLMVPHLFWFVADYFERRKNERIVLQIGKRLHRFRSPAVVVSANRYADTTRLDESNFKREDLQGGELAAYISSTKTRVSHLRFLARLMVGNWKKDPDLTELTAPEVTLWTRHRKEKVSIDGEVTDLKTPLEIKLKKRYVPLLIPTKEAA